MSVINLSSENARNVFFQQMGTNRGQFERDVDIIEEWLKTQKHLPEVPNRSRIKFFLTITKNSIELAKKRLDMYYTIRSIMPDYFVHPRLEAIQLMKDAMYYIIMPQLTKTGNRICFIKLRNRQVFDQVDFNQFFSYINNLLEIRTAEDECVDETYIVDMKGLSLKDILKITPSTFKKMSFISKNVYTNRISAIILFNSPILETLLTIVKPMLNPKITERITIQKDVDSLFKVYPRELFPKDYGGDELSLDELNDLWSTKLTQYYDRFDKLEKMRVDESLRAEELKNDDLMGFYGNFKKLDVD